MKTILLLLLIFGAQSTFGYSFGDSFGTIGDPVGHSPVGGLGGLDMGEPATGDQDTSSFGGLDMGENVSDSSPGLDGRDYGGGEQTSSGVVSGTTGTVTSSREPGSLLRSPPADTTAYISIAITETGKALMRSHFNGKIKQEVVDTSLYNVHPNSEIIINRLLKNLKESQMMDSIANLGLKGVKIVVLEGLVGSFYSIDADAIFLADTDVAEYGLVPLHHELLHAGLHKAQRSGSIPNTLFTRIGNINKNHFSHFDGYVGMSQRLYGQNGYGVQEAAVIGMTLVKIRRQSDTIPNINLADKAKKYYDDVLGNKFLTRSLDGLPIRVIDSSKMTPIDVEEEYLQFFLTKDSTINSMLSDARARVKTALPNLCETGTILITGKVSCRDSEVVYSKSEALIYRVCGQDMKFGSQQTESCGAVIGYKGP